MRVFIGSGCAAPKALISALAARGGEVYDVEVCHYLGFADAPYASRDLLDRFRHNALYIGRNVRPAVNEGVADYTPVNLSETTVLFRRKPFDIALIQTGKPDADGWCSLGVSVDIVAAAVMCSGRVIAEINPRMPRVCGKARVHVSRLFAMIHNEAPLIEFPLPEITPEALKIGELVASLIEDGATLRVGMGDIPGAVLSALKDKKNLGFHGEVVCGAMLPLIQTDVFNGSQKTILPGKIVTSTCLGGETLYQTIHENPLFEFRPAGFVCDPMVIAKNRRMVSVGSAIEVDLTGQVCGESVGGKFYSGFGAQLDFLRGAARSEGGKPIIALRSTTANERVSRIAAQLRAGTGVMATRADVHYVVTEHGIASLHGKSVRERALALISIAHPKFREELMSQARELKWVHPHQISMPRDIQPYPSEYETLKRFRHKNIFFRPILPTDESLLKELFYSHSKRTILNRFFTPLRRLTPDLVQRFVTLDYQNDMAIVGLAKCDGRERMVCVGRYFRDRATNDAEVAFTVHDKFQGFGLGRFLMTALMRVAREHGISGFTADVRARNTPMLRLFRGSATTVETRKEKGFYHLRFSLNQ
jgi:acyl-CoA hydrolase